VAAVYAALMLVWERLEVEDRNEGSESTVLYVTLSSAFNVQSGGVTGNAVEA
jgi:hypothetical protein